MQNSLIKELKQLYSGEGFSCAMFFVIWLYCIFNDAYIAIARSLHVAFPVLSLCFILGVGTVFWKLMLNVVSKQERMYLTAGQKKMFKIFQCISLIMLVISSIFMLLSFIYQQEYKWIGLFLYIFATVEYINYYHVRLSYLTPREFKALLKHRRLRASHLNRTLHEKKQLSD